MGEVAGGQEQRVAPQFLGAASHQLPERAVLGVRAHDGEAHDPVGVQETERDHDAPVQHVPVVGYDAELAVVSRERQQELRELHVVVVAERGLRAAEAAEVAAQPRGGLDGVRGAEVVRVRRDHDDRVRVAHGAGQLLHGGDGGRDLAAGGATDLGDEQWRVRADAALHDDASWSPTQTEPRSVVEVAAVISTVTIAPGRTAPATLTVTFWRVRPRCW